MIDNITVEKARNADIINFFEHRYGFSFAHHNGGYRCKEHKSLAVSDNRLSWFWHSKGLGGHGALDYLIKVENTPFRQAVGILMGVIPSQNIPSPSLRITAPPKTLILPEKKGIPLKLYDYLCNRRGIDYEIVQSLIQKEKLYEDKRGNVVFVGYDSENKARFASLRGTCGDFRGDCAGSDKQYGFCMENPHSERLYIFESPIDCISHASLLNAMTGDNSVWERHTRLSLSGTAETALTFFLNQHKAVNELVFCLDNDKAGREAAETMAKKYAGKGYAARLKLPQGKDYNEDLLSYKRQLSINKRVERTEL